MEKDRVIKSAKIRPGSVTVGLQANQGKVTLFKKGNIPRAFGGSSGSLPACDVVVPGVTKTAGAVPEDLIRTGDDKGQTIRSDTVERLINQKMDEAEKAKEDAEKIKKEAEDLRKKATTELEQAQTKSKKSIEEGQTRAKKMIEEAKIYSQSMQKASEKEGYELGYQKGIQQGKEEVKHLIEVAMATLNQTVEARNRILKRTEPEIAKLAIRIAERIISTEVTTNYDIVVNLIREATERVKDREQIAIKVNQADLENVRSHKEVIAGRLEGVKSIEITADPRVERGGCVIETNLGNVDSRISTQIAALEEAFGQYMAVKEEDSAESQTEAHEQSDEAEGPIETQTIEGSEQ